MKKRKTRLAFLPIFFLIISVFTNPMLVYAEEQTDSFDINTIEVEEITEPKQNGSTVDHDTLSEVTKQQEIASASKQSTLENEDSKKENAKVKAVADIDEVIEVPESGMVIVGGVYYGISKSWYENNYPNGEVLNFSISIPNSVTTIYNDGLRDEWTNEKQKRGCITDYNYASDKTYTDKYAIVNIDFSNATNLTMINNQAAMGCSSLIGTLDLSGTKVETLGKSAFSGCTGLTGVILPETLKNIGSIDSGGVFNGCTGLQFVRTANGNTDTVFELPQNLEIIGRQSFKGCTGFPQNTSVVIPASVTFVGSDAFYETKSISTIIVLTDDASGYDGGAFKGNEYGVGKRLTVFNNVLAKKTFKPSGNSTYINSITYEFTLHYGTEKDEKKLWGQAVNVCKDKGGNWYIDENYVIPSPTISVPVGYVGRWLYNDTILTNQTILKLEEDELTLKVSYTLQEPTIQLVVDGQVIKTEDTYPKLNLSNNKEHTIGVNVSHPIETVSEADVEVKFEYKWTDVWRGGMKGPRMSEKGFGNDDWGKPLGKNTITINGSEHERTNAGNYSQEDYGDGYYLLEIYGYSCAKSGGSWDLFYKSVSTVIGFDSDATTDTAYLFDVITSDPAQAPEVSVTGNDVDYGYDNVEMVASVDEIDGQFNTYQWYKATRNGQFSGGEKIDGETSKTLEIEDGKDTGEYYYYLEVTSKKDLNGDIVTTGVPITFTVNKLDSAILITTENMNKTYDKEAVSNPKVTKNGSAKEVVLTWYEKSDGKWKKLNGAPSNAGTYKVVASVEADDIYNGATTEKEFVIKKAMPMPNDVDNLVISKGEFLGTIKLPKGFRWKDKNVIADKLGVCQFEAIFTPNDILNYEIISVQLNVEVVTSTTSNHLPIITAKDKVLMVGDKFDDEIALNDVMAYDQEDGDLTAKIKIINNMVDTSKAGTYTVTFKVTDKDGASVTKTITVTVKKEEQIPLTNSDIKTGESINIMLWGMMTVISFVGVVMALALQRRKSE